MVSQAIGELETLNRSTERVFLAVGDKLMEFRASARQIASDMAAVTELIAGEQGRNASQALSKLLDHSRQIDRRIEASGSALASVRDLSNRLRKTFSGLTNLVAVFRSLCTLTQIETARLGGAGADLGHLAAEIRPLSESIQASGEGVVESSDRLERAVERAIRQGSGLRAAELKDMPALISGVLDSLRLFEERRQAALESSSRQAAEYAAVGQAIDDLVGAIQFHDITRQQVEHVLEALRQLGGHSNGSGAGVNPARLDTRVVLGLQSSQLVEAARLFAQSTEQMDRALESIAARLQNASEAVRELTGVSSHAGDSFFQKMEAQFSGILKVLGTCTAAQAEIESTVTGLAETIGGMRATVDGIRGTEIQIQRISTNATIRATHIGASGVALNKIAEVMQHLALESNANTEEASATLDAMSEVAGRVSWSAGSQAEKDATTNQVAGEMQHALAGLHASSISSEGRVDHISQLSARLAEDIGALRARISAGRMFAEVVGRVRGEFEAAAAHEAGESSQDAAIAKEQLEHLAKTYTMQSQRDVHQSVVGTAVGVGGTPVAATAAAPKAGSGEPDFGDNVDLF